jgi:organic radical activating enzyme
MNEFTPGVHKFVKHLEHIQKMKNGEAVAPIHVSIWPTIRCNFKCSYCCCKDTPRNAPDLGLEVYIRAINVLRRYGTKAIEFSGGGEPLLWESFNSAVSYAAGIGLKVSLITNGVYLNKIPKEVLEKLAWIRISFQSAEHAKSIDYAHLKGIKYSGSCIATGEIGGIQKLVSMAEFCGENKIPLRIATEKPCGGEFESRVRHIVSLAGYPYVFFSDKLHGVPDGCYMAWIRAAIDWEGNFLPCPAMHLSEEYKGLIPEKFRLCHVDRLEEWINQNRTHDLGFRCSTCNCGKENNDFFHKVVANIADEDFV